MWESLYRNHCTTTTTCCLPLSQSIKSPAAEQTISIISPSQLPYGVCLPSLLDLETRSRQNPHLLEALQDKGIVVQYIPTAWSTEHTPPCLVRSNSSLPTTSSFSCTRVRSRLSWGSWSYVLIHSRKCSLSKNSLTLQLAWLLLVNWFGTSLLNYRQFFTFSTISNP